MKMQSTLIKVGQDRQTLITELFDAFKLHLRILHDIEDSSIEMYLGAAIDQIGILAGTDVFSTQWRVFYPETVDYSYPSTLTGWYCGRWNISNIIIKDAQGNDVTSEYTFDREQGMIYPHPGYNMDITFDTGYVGKAEIPHNLLNIIFRLGADFFENREANRIGEPKQLPGWVEYSLASIWSPRC